MALWRNSGNEGKTEGRRPRPTTRLEAPDVENPIFSAITMFGENLQRITVTGITDRGFMVWDYRSKNLDERLRKGCGRR